MAQKVTIVLTDDTDPTKTADETVTFSLDGTNYEIDLTRKNADKFRGLFQDYIAAGRKTGKAKGAKSSAPKSNAAEVRAWAKANGHEVPDRGRIPADVRAAFDKAS